jgi:hypothetical protein
VWFAASRRKLRLTNFLPKKVEDDYEVFCCSHNAAQKIQMKGKLMHGRKCYINYLRTFLGCDRLANKNGRAMKKRHFVATVATVVGFLCVFGWSLVKTPSLPPARSLVLDVEPIPSDDNISRRCALLVSNISEFPVEYAEGFNKLWVEITYKSNGVWITHEVRTPGVGSFLLAPHAVLRDTFNVPETATVFKVGLHITSLTWRGRFAFRMSRSKTSRHLSPLIGFLLVQDEKNRSTTEWSEVQDVARLWKVN